jgi:colanic acid/amylovoran biosynthesis glycosyltransferase
MGCGNLLPPTDGAKSSGKTLIFLSVCRLIPKKGVDDALYALAKIKHQLPAWQYHIAGDGPQREVLEKLASTLRINNSVVFHGSVDQETISKFLLNADLFLAPSKTAPDGDCEGLPVAILEASSAGIPVISTYHEGIPEAVENNVSGFLVPENNIEALAASILLLGQNPAKRREMGLRGQEIIRSKFSQGLLDQKLIELVRAHSSTDRH